jgi:hypothetical protein
MATIVAQGNIGSSVGAVLERLKQNISVTNSGSSSYIFNGEGLTNANNPNLTLRRGGTYTFNVNVPGLSTLIRFKVLEPLMLTIQALRVMEQ